MRADEFKLSIRPLSEMHPLRTESRAGFWVDLSTTLENLEAGTGVFLAHPDGPLIGKALIRMRANIQNGLSRRGRGRWRCTSDFELGGVWISPNVSHETPGQALGEARGSSFAPSTVEEKQEPPATRAHMHTMTAEEEAAFNAQHPAKPYPEIPAAVDRVIEKRIAPEQPAQDEQPEDPPDEEPEPEPEVNPLRFAGVPAATVCTCPDWWKDSATWREGIADQPGYHHHDSCPLHDRKVDAKGEPRCTCDAYHREDTPHFRIDVANEGHEVSCALYRVGAHYWPIAPTTQAGEPYTAVCPWCGESREFTPYAPPPEKVITKPARGRPRKVEAE